MEQDSHTQQQKLAQANAANVSVPDFLLKTYQMLEENKYTSLVSWSKDGTMIVIKKPLAFSEEVLPIFFKHNNLSSFIRQLNNYSFRKMKSKEYEYCFYHEMFRRDKRELLKYIKRKKVIRPKSQKSSAKQAHAKKSAQVAVVTPQTPESIEPTPVKKIQTEDGSSMKVFQDNQIAYLRRANQQLREELLKRQSQDQSLRQVIAILTNYYGAENVQNVLKMADMSKDQQFQDQNNIQEPNKYAQMFHQPPTDPQSMSGDFNDKKRQSEQQQFAASYAIDPFQQLNQSDGTYQGEGIDTADHYSASPRMADEPGTNYKCMMDLPITDINTKLEPDFFREDSAGQSYPYSTMGHPF